MDVQCLKCGRKIQDGQVFCEGCLQVMQTYPVKPGTAVQLPKHREISEEKKKATRHRTQSPAEQNVQLRGTIRKLRTAIVLLVLLLGVAVAALVFVVMKKPEILELVR